MNECIDKMIFCIYNERESQKKRDTKRCPFSFVFLLKVSVIATEVNSRVAALTGTSPSAASSEWTLLHSGFSAQEKPSYPPSFLLFAKRHARLTCSLASALTLARCRYHLFAA